MQSSVTYTIVISRHPRGFLAACPAFTDCETLGRSRSAAYQEIKHLIRKRLAQVIDDQTPLPQDPIASVKHLRLNIQDIEKEVELT
jgi:predicted RNase H-like HicB family nuclease